MMFQSYNTKARNEDIIDYIKKCVLQLICVVNGIGRLDGLSQFPSSLSN